MLAQSLSIILSAALATQPSWVLFTATDSKGNTTSFSYDERSLLWKMRDTILVSRKPVSEIGIVSLHLPLQFFSGH